MTLILAPNLRIGRLQDLSLFDMNEDCREIDVPGTSSFGSLNNTAVAPILRGKAKGTPEDPIVEYTANIVAP